MDESKKNDKKKKTDIFLILRRFFSVPLVWLTPKICDDSKEHKTYYLPDFAKPDELKIDDNNQETQKETEKKLDNTDQSKDQVKQSDDIDWLNLDEVEFLPSKSNLYMPVKNNNDEKVDDAKLKEKLILSMLTGHLHRYCEDKLKCSVDDLVLEFQRSNTKPEKNHKINEQEKLISSKIDNLKSEHSK